MGGAATVKKKSGYGRAIRVILFPLCAASTFPPLLLSRAGEKGNPEEGGEISRRLRRLGL